MLGLFIGIICGGMELFLLMKMLKCITGNKTGLIAVFLLLKLLVLACAFVPVILFLRNELLWCGIGISGALVIGSITIFGIKNGSKGGKKV